MAHFLIMNGDEPIRNYRIINDPNSSIYLFSRDPQSVFPLVGSLSIMNITNSLFGQYNDQIDQKFYNMTFNDDHLFFNYMRIVVDLYMGVNVMLILNHKEYDDLSVELLLGYIYDRYGISAQYIDEYTEPCEYLDVEFDPLKKDILSFDLERFRILSMMMNLTGNQYREKVFLWR